MSHPCPLSHLRACFSHLAPHFLRKGRVLGLPEKSSVARPHPVWYSVVQRSARELVNVPAFGAAIGGGSVYMEEVGPESVVVVVG